VKGIRRKNNIYALKAAGATDAAAI